MIINPGILSGSWTVSLSQGFSPGPSNRGLLVKHDVPVGKITAAAVAWECALGLYTKNAVTLHQSCVMDKLDWCVCVCVFVYYEREDAVNTHLCQTHLCRLVPMCTAWQSRRQWVWAAFRSRTVFNIIPLRVLRQPRWGLIPALWLQGSPLFFTPYTDIITSLKEPPRLAFSPLIHLLCPHLRFARFWQIFTSRSQSAAFSASQESCTHCAHRPLCLQSLAFCVFLHLASLIPFIRQKSVTFLWPMRPQRFFFFSHP